MGFQFKLEALRRYRLFEQENLQKALADAQRLLEEARTRLAAHVALRDKTEADFRRHPEAGTLYRNYLRQLALEIETLRDRLKKAEIVCEDKRRALLAAMKKRKTLDRLKEKSVQAYLEGLNQDETKFIDEMAINRFTLKQQ